MELWESDNEGDTGNSSDSSSEDFAEIMEYFEPQRFKEMSSLEKRAFKAQKQRYDTLRVEMPEITIHPPGFMLAYSERLSKRKKANERAAAKKARLEARKDEPDVQRRVSGRAREASNIVEQPGVEESDIEDDIDYSVKIYFTPSEWASMSLIVRNHAQNALKDYQTAKDKGIPIVMPKFMKRANESASSCSGSQREPEGTGSVQREPCSNALAERSTNSQSNKFIENMVPQKSVGSPLITKRSVSQLSTSQSSVQNRVSTTKDQVAFPPIRGLLLSSVSTRNTTDQREVDDVQPEAEGLTDETPSLFGDDQFIETDSDVRSAIKAAIKLAVPKIEEVKLVKLLDTLQLKGVESVGDFNLIDASWLEGHGLNEIQVKKIMAELKKHGSEKENVSGAQSAKKAPKQKKQPVPLMKPLVTEQPTIASRPSLSTKVLEVGMLDLRIDFGKFSDSLLLSLEKQETPTSSDRLRLVQILAQDIYQKYAEVRKMNPSVKQKTPGREVYKKVVAVIFKEYSSCFEDTLNNKKFKTGSWSLENQLETCIENMYRPKRPKGERAESSKGNRSAACILPHKYSIAMTKKMQAAAETSRKTLLSMFRSPRDQWDWTSIKEMLKNETSLGAQRALINSRKRDITFIIDKWPFLSELSGLLCHLDEITGQSLKENFENFIDENMDGLIDYLLAMSPQRIKLMRLKKDLDFGSGEHRRLLAALAMLAIHWNENFSELVSLVEENTMPHEVEDLIKLPSTPHIVALGNSVYTAKTFFVFLDQKCLCSNLSNAMEALMCSCAAFFVFGVLYPTELSITLSYLERMVANLSDGDGLLKSTTAKGAPSHAAFTKVKKLEEDIQQFEKELVGDD